MDNSMELDVQEKFENVSSLNKISASIVQVNRIIDVVKTGFYSQQSKIVTDILNCFNKSVFN